MEKINVSCFDLKKGLKSVLHAASSSSSIPLVTNNVLLTVENNKLILSTTNFDISMTAWIDTIGADKNWEITIPAHIFANVIKEIPDERVYLLFDEKNGVLTIKSDSYLIQNIKVTDDLKDFPRFSIPDFNDKSTISVPASSFKEMIKQVIFAASKDNIRPELMGAFFKAENNLITMVASDGYRLSLRTATIINQLQDSFSANIPKDTLTILTKIIDNKEERVLVKILENDDKIAFKTKNVVLVSKILGKFPEYKHLFSESPKLIATVSTSSLLQSCRQVDHILSKKLLKTMTMDFVEGSKENPINGQIEISAYSEETGEYKNKIEAKIDGLPMVISINAKYMIDVLKVIKSQNIIIQANNPELPIVVRPTDDDTFVNLIMPIKIP